MRKRYINLQLFDGGGDGGTGGQGGSVAGGDGGQGSTGNATYSYEQAEEIANARADRASRTALADFFRKQGMTEEQVTHAINDFKEKQKKNQPDVSAITRERDDAMKELQQLKNEKVLTSKGVKQEDLDYVLFKVEKLVDDKTDFAKAADKFLKDNPRYSSGGAYRVSGSASAVEHGSGGSVNISINDAIRRAAKR